MKRRLFFAVVLTACGSNLGTLGVIDEEDAGVDAGRDAAVANDAAVADAADAAAEAGPARVSPEGGRPIALDCSDAGRAAGEPSPDAGGCTADGECDAGADGRCGLRRFADGGAANVCTYQACYVDSTCTGVCGCGVGSKAQNLCLSNSNCRIDGDCPSGERCVYSDPIILRARLDDAVNQGNEVGGISYSGQAIGYFCTTPQDDCRGVDSGIAHRCTYNLETKRWEMAFGP